MLKKSLKYLAIAAVNLILLTTFLALWTDNLELTLNDSVRVWEFLRIVGFCVAALLAMRLLIYFFRIKRIENPVTKIKLASLLTLLVSSYLYVTYTSKIIKNIVIHREFRQRLSNKISPSNGLANGTQAKGLTIKEYQEISKYTGFITLSSAAFNINYNFQYDGFLRDYSFSLTYNLPEQIQVDTFSYKKGDFLKFQSFEVFNHTKKVTYQESEQ